MLTSAPSRPSSSGRSIAVPVNTGVRGCRHDQGGPLRSAPSAAEPVSPGLVAGSSFGPPMAAAKASTSVQRHRQQDQQHQRPVAGIIGHEG